MPTVSKLSRKSGDIFDPALAQKLHDYVYAAGYSRDPEAAYVAFRGRAATPDALLRKRGLARSPGIDAWSRFFLAGLRDGALLDRGHVRLLKPGLLVPRRMQSAGNAIRFDGRIAQLVEQLNS